MLICFLENPNPVKIRSFLLIFKPFPCKGVPKRARRQQVSSTVCLPGKPAAAASTVAGGARHAKPRRLSSVQESSPRDQGEAA